MAAKKDPEELVSVPRRLLDKCSMGIFELRIFERAEIEKGQGNLALRLDRYDELREMSAELSAILDNAGTT